MAKYEFSVSTNIQGSAVTEIVELDDDMTEEDIQQEFEMWLWENIDTGFRKI